jgi:hypothetical protein
MALSSIFCSTTLLYAGETFPSSQTWEDVNNYTKFFIQIQTDQPCKITVYQCTTSGVPLLDKSITQVFNYQNVGQVLIFEGNIVCNKISFVLQNVSNVNETDLFFSVLYK